MDKIKRSDIEKETYEKTLLNIYMKTGNFSYKELTKGKLNSLSYFINFASFNPQNDTEKYLVTLVIALILDSSENIGKLE